MENERGLTVVLWVVVLFGIFFLGRGITGKVISNTSLDSCITDDSCSSGMICCLNQDDSGMCYSPETCSQITNSKLEKPETNRNSMFDIGLGLLVLIAVLIAFYGINRKSKIRVSRKRTRIKKRY